MVEALAPDERDGGSVVTKYWQLMTACSDAHEHQFASTYIAILDGQLNDETTHPWLIYSLLYYSRQ